MKRTVIALVIIGLLATVLISCSAASKQTSPTTGSADRAVVESGKQVPPTAPRPGEEANLKSGASPLQPPANTSNQASWDRMIIRNASLSLTVKDVEDSLNAIRAIASTASGWVAQSNTRYEGERQVANVTLQVPSAAFDATVSEIRKLAIKVETETSNSQDVTEEFTDLQSQLRNLQATEASLLNLYARAERIEDILRLQQELTNIRGQIEKIQGRINFLSRRTEMSTITVSLLPQGGPRPGDKPIWKPLETAAKAWETSAVFLQALADVAITIVVFFWWLIPLAVAGWLILRSRMRQRPTPVT